MRIAPDELGDDALDFDFLRRVVLGGKRVMREDLTTARDERQAGDQHHNRAFHDVSLYSWADLKVGPYVQSAAYFLGLRLLYAASTNISVVHGPVVFP